MNITNAQISDALSLLAKLMEIHGENAFKAKSYANASFQIDRFANPLSEMDAKSIAAIRGVGDSTAKLVIAFLETDKLALLENYIQKTPAGVLEMMRIKGIGPKKINTIWQQMEIESVGELLYACNENRLTLFKGFGEKTQQNIKDTINYFLSQQGFFLFQQAEAFALEVIVLLQKAFPQATISFTGQLRRQLETMGEVELVITESTENIISFLHTINKATIEITETNRLVFSFTEGPKIILHTCTVESFEFTLFRTTGNDAFVKAFEERFPTIGFKPGLSNSDESIFEAAGIQFIPPCLRESEEALSQTIPKLIEVKDVKGIIHSHSTWSDGSDSLLKMAETAIRSGFEYLVISDHSRSAGYANGLSAERIAQQHLEIDALNKKLTPFRIFKSIESDILIDGNLDYEPEVLDTFDLVIASVHSVLKMTEEKAMARLITAIENPYTSILGHMTGRLLLSRSGYPLDHKKIIDACAANEVVIELNAHPRRLDMDWRWIPYAQSKQVLISINPDAHFVEGYNDIRYGVLSAQKGALRASQNLSSYTLADFEDFLTQQHQKRMG